MHYETHTLLWLVHGIVTELLQAKDRRIGGSERQHHLRGVEGVDRLAAGLDGARTV